MSGVSKAAGQFFSIPNINFLLRDCGAKAIRALFGKVLLPRLYTIYVFRTSDRNFRLTLLYTRYKKEEAEGREGEPFKYVKTCDVYVSGLIVLSFPRLVKSYTPPTPVALHLCENFHNTKTLSLSLSAFRGGDSCLARAARLIYTGRSCAIDLSLSSLCRGPEGSRIRTRWL